MRLATVELPGDAMMLRAQDGGVAVAIPVRIERYSGRRQVVVPQGISAALNAQRAPTALQLNMGGRKREMAANMPFVPPDVPPTSLRCRGTEGTFLTQATG